MTPSEGFFVAAHLARLFEEQQDDRSTGGAQRNGPRAINGDRETPHFVGAAGLERRRVADSIAVAVGATVGTLGVCVVLQVGVAAQLRVWRVPMRAGTFICLVPTF